MQLQPLPGEFCVCSVHFASTLLTKVNPSALSTRSYLSLILNANVHVV